MIPPIRRDGKPQTIARRPGRGHSRSAHGRGKTVAVRYGLSTAVQAASVYSLELCIYKQL